MWYFVSVINTLLVLTSDEKEYLLKNEISKFVKILYLFVKI